jgi:hypothetical protein
LKPKKKKKKKKRRAHSKSLQNVESDDRNTGSLMCLLMFIWLWLQWLTSIDAKWMV